MEGIAHLKGNEHQFLVQCWLGLLPIFGDVAQQICLILQLSRDHRLRGKHTTLILIGEQLRPAGEDSSDETGGVEACDSLTATTHKVNWNAFLRTDANDITGQGNAVVNDDDALKMNKWHFRDHLLLAAHPQPPLMF